MFFSLGAMAEQLVKDLPKHLTSLSETAVLLGQDVVNRVWDLKAEIEKRIADMSNKPEEKSKSIIKKNKHLNRNNIYIFSKNSYTTSIYTITDYKLINK